MRSTSNIQGFQCFDWVPETPESRNGFLACFFLVTLLGATRSETSGGTPRDPLETRCGALQLLSGRFTEDFGCKCDADFVVQSFVAEFLVRSVRILARIFQMGVRSLGSNFGCDFL